MGFSLTDIPLVGGPLDHLINGPKDIPGPPGVGGPAADARNLVRDPSTGLFYDPTTGTSYSDPHGRQPVADPNLAQRSAIDAARAGSFLDKLNGYANREAATFSDEQGLARNLQNTIRGVGAPSVAQNQLVQGMEQAANQQQSMASGASGTDAALARMQAARNTGNLQAATNQQQALVRAQEVADAQRNLGGLLKGMADQSRGFYDTNVNAADSFNRTGLDAQKNQQGITERTNAANVGADNEFYDKLLDKGGQALKTAGA